MCVCVYLYMYIYIYIYIYIHTYIHREGERERKKERESEKRPVVNIVVGIADAHLPEDVVPVLAQRIVPCERGGVSESKSDRENCLLTPYWTESTLSSR